MRGTRACALDPHTEFMHFYLYSRVPCSLFKPGASYTLHHHHQETTETRCSPIGGRTAAHPRFNHEASSAETVPQREMSLVWSLHERSRTSPMVIHESHIAHRKTMEDGSHHQSPKKEDG